MTHDFMCNGCGYEFNLEEGSVKECPDCKNADVFRIPVRMPAEGYQSCVFDEQQE